MVVHPAGVAEIGNLDANDLEVETIVFSLALLAGGRRGRGRGLVERNSRHFLRE